MTVNNHLPECPTHNTELCICPELRACEQRSYALGIEVGKHDGWIAGRTAGVQAAREAVARLLPSPGDAPLIDLRDALAAIDALKD